MSAVQSYCCCGNVPCDGLDCGVYLPGQAPRKRAAPLDASKLNVIRKQAWETRRQKYGARGHS